MERKRWAGDEEMHWIEGHMLWSIVDDWISVVITVCRQRIGQL